MASPDEVLDGIIRSVKDVDALPHDASIKKYEPDESGEDSNLRLPLFHIEPVTVEYLDPHNTSQVGYRYDKSGNKIGQVYHSEYEMTFEVQLWVAAQSMYDASKLGQNVRRALYRHDSDSLNVPLPTDDYEYFLVDDDGTRIRPDDVWQFTFNEAERTDDTTYSPTIRRWRYECAVSSYDEFETEESYIEAVSTPNY